MADNNRPFATFTHTQPVVILWQTPEEKTQRLMGKQAQKKKNTDLCSSWDGILPCYFGFKKKKRKKENNPPKKSSKTHLNTQPYKTSIAEGPINFLASLKRTCCQDSFLEIL